MITRIIVRNYRCLKDLDFTPQEDMNIIIGDNEAGKSTLLEALSLVLSGRIDGRRPGEDMNPFWFNTEVVSEFYAAIDAGQHPDPPKITIEAYLAKNDQPQVLRGK